MTEANDRRETEVLGDHAASSARGPAARLARRASGPVASNDRRRREIAVSREGAVPIAFRATGSGSSREGRASGPAARSAQAAPAAARPALRPHRATPPRGAGRPSCRRMKRLTREEVPPPCRA